MSQIIQCQGSLYTDAERRSAVLAYLTLGNVRSVAKITGIPSRTLYDWQKTEWWEILVAQLRAERDALLDSAFTKVIEKAMCCVMDRLENGDVIVLKNGLITRQPVSVNHAAHILDIVHSIREKLRAAMQTKRIIPLHELAAMLEMLGEARVKKDTI